MSEPAVAVRAGRTAILTWARIVLGVLVGIYVLSTVVPFDERPEWLDTWFYGVVIVLVALAALARPVLVRRDRAAWAFIGVAVTSWSAGDLYWASTFSSTPADEIPVPSLADGFYVGLYPLAYVGFVLLARSIARRVPASVWLDGLVTSLAAGAVFSALTLKEVIAAAEGSLAEVITNLSYPIGDLVLVVVAVAALAMVRWRLDPVWWLLAAGFALFAVADTAYLFGLANDTYSNGGWVDGLWLLGLALVPLAGSMPGDRRTGAVQGFAALLVPILFSLSALVVLVVGTAGDLHPVTIVLAAGCLVAAGVRTALTFEQTRALAASQVEALTDQLTGLGNRRMLLERLPGLTASGAPLEFTLVGVDHLAEINDTLGYRAGDAVLAAVGRRLADEMRGGAIAARLGGAEIAVLRQTDRDAAQLDHATRSLLAALSEPVVVDGAQVELELSAGIALAPRHATEADDLVRCANDALRRARATRGQVELYDPAQDVGRGFGPGIFPDLLAALDRHDLGDRYQPEVDAISGAVVDLEASLLWLHPVHGEIGPPQLGPLAARAGLTRRLSRELLEQAVRRAAWWRLYGVEVGVSVDLRAADVLDSRLPYDVARMLADRGLPPRALRLEVPEDVLLVLDQGRTERALQQLRSLGVRLCLDHYGRVAPSLARLRTLPVDTVKLDGAFVASILHSGQDAAVVRSTVDLAASLGVRTVATGVDTPELAEAITAYGCQGLQGDRYGAPLPVPTLAGWLMPGAVPDESRALTP